MLKQLLVGLLTISLFCNLETSASCPPPHVYPLTHNVEFPPVDDYSLNNYKNGLPHGYDVYQEVNFRWYTQGPECWYHGGTVWMNLPNNSHEPCSTTAPTGNQQFPVTTINPSPEQLFFSSKYHLNAFVHTNFDTARGLYILWWDFHWDNAIDGNGNTVNISKRFFMPILPSVPGDVNYDFVTNFTDVAQVVSHWGLNPTEESAVWDLNKNGSVDIDDLVTVIINYGAST